MSTLLPPPVQQHDRELRRRPKLGPRRAATAVLETIATTAPQLFVDLATVLGSLALVDWALSLFGGAGMGGAPLYQGVSATLVLVFALSGLYPAIALNVVVEMRRLALGSTVAFGAYLLSIGTALPGAVHVPGVAGVWLLTTIALPCARAAARRLLARTSWWGRSAFLVGEPAETERAARHVRRQGLRPIPTAMDPNDPQAWSDLARLSPTWVIVCPKEAWPSALSGPAPLSIPNVLVVAPAISESIGRLWLEPAEVGTASAFHVRNTLHTARCRFLKRALDLGITLLILPLILPLMITIALLIKLTSKGPLFFGHRRLGRGGRWFKAWKFRTMVVDAETALRRYLEEHPELEREWKETQKLRRDPRITRIGRILRKTSLDELPQIWNVLRGQMSLVGPRPIVGDEVSRYGPTYGFYSQALPGVTGLWQVSGRNNTTYHERVRLDAAYVGNWSIWLDLYILLRTVRTVFFAEGAY